MSKKPTINNFHIEGDLNFCLAHLFLYYRHQQTTFDSHAPTLYPHFSSPTNVDAEQCKKMLHYHAKASKMQPFLFSLATLKVFFFRTKTTLQENFYMQMSVTFSCLTKDSINSLYRLKYLLHCPNFFPENVALAKMACF